MSLQLRQSTGTANVSFSNLVSEFRNGQGSKKDQKNFERHFQQSQGLWADRMKECLPRYCPGLNKMPQWEETVNARLQRSIRSTASKRAPKEGFVYEVALDEKNNAVGFVSANVIAPAKAGKPGILYVRFLAVDKEHEAHGIPASLLRSCFEEGQTYATKGKYEITVAFHEIETFYKSFYEEGSAYRPRLRMMATMGASVVPVVTDSDGVQRILPYGQPPNDDKYGTDTVPLIPAFSKISQGKLVPAKEITQLPAAEVLYVMKQVIDLHMSRNAIGDLPASWYTEDEGVWASKGDMVKKLKNYLVELVGSAEYVQTILLIKTERMQHHHGAPQK